MSREKPSPHRQSATLARVLLVVVALFLGAGNFAFWKFSFFSGNPFPAMPGLVVGSTLASVAMLGALWVRKGMARTALVVFIWIMMFVFAMPGLIMMSDRTTARMDHLIELGAGLGAYLLANLVLIVAGPIHKLGASRGCRG